MKRSTINFDLKLCLNFKCDIFIFVHFFTHFFFMYKQFECIVANLESHNSKINFVLIFYFWGHNNFKTNLTFLKFL